MSDEKISITLEEYTGMVRQNVAMTMLVNALLNSIGKTNSTLYIKDTDMVLSILQMVAPEPFREIVEALSKEVEK